MLIARNLAAVLDRIHQAERAAGRPEGSVQLLAVSKRHPPEAIREAYAAGQREFGENYPQELASKAEILKDLPGIRFHLIGHLQSNKVKLAVRFASSVDTLDSPSLAVELGKRAASRPEPLPVLLEVNVGGEIQKHGCSPEQLAAVMEAVLAQPSLRLRGLMTVPPHTEDPEGARPFFRQLRRLRDRYGTDLLPELSMGMSHDLEVAISEGATQVRIGTAIFGERPLRG
ncbi:MAG: YggS family pyridoxal phosphate-dependent enzyme [Myxococcales bacterium]|nr:YggS family pyridoxal phosphate-dependent enzyme [Polyangiaceae bacterium]MDW8249010.1 YggS family pyridoxal phosphate-dependent enzyme [Myxococcales bacterium]